MRKFGSPIQQYSGNFILKTSGLALRKSGFKIRSIAKKCKVPKAAAGGVWSLHHSSYVANMFWFVLNFISYIVRGFWKRKKRPAIEGSGDADASVDGRGRVFPVGPDWRSSSFRTRPSPKKSFRAEPPDTFFTRNDLGRGLMRRQSFVEVEGSGKSVAVLTSGGDAQGK